ncbi:hypothetical protein HC031_09060 [Planosporangium thailandense]|uniref:Uncharacterized protein n=1 Tax=Planosporangium thailandense TaxID=765197 RepID=A0ABX0XVM3_9ACTN|nr:hypothetical protein [Planosporangium thailandense]NJC69866.1 hypothetical protein [Planosporangium thailandense]
MGVDVELIRVEQQGTSPRRRRDTQVAVVADARGRFTEALERVQHGGKTPMLDRIDPYGLLELSPVEMPQFLGELSELVARAEGTAEHEVLAAVRRLAEACRDDSDLRLRLVGD